MNKVGLGIVGLGYMGRVHLRNSLKLPNVRLVAVSDVSRKALNLAKKTGVKKTYTSYEQLLNDPEVDCVVVSLPTHFHLECAKKAAEAKKHIFLEKPMARNVEEAMEIISTAQRNSVKLMIGYPLHFSPPFRTLREEVRSGALGIVEFAFAANISSGPFFHRTEEYVPTPVPEWWFDKELTGGGALLDLGSHMINLLRWYFGEITNIRSHLGHRFNMDFEDSATCLAKFESGTRAVISVGWFSQDFKVEVELYGTVKHASCRDPPSNRSSNALSPVLKAIQMLTMGNSRFFWPQFAELQYFTSCLLRDKSPSPSGEDGLKDLEIIEQAYKNQISLN